MENNWYVIKVFPGKERILNEAFNREISLGRIKNITRFVCPTEKEMVTVRKKKVQREKVIYGGYLYFEAESQLNEDQLKEVASLPNVMGMLGDKTPIKMSPTDVRRILKDELLEEHRDAKKLKFVVGEQVKVNDGPFVSFIGHISEVKDDKVRVEIKIFGRNNCVILGQNQIDKVI
jgi:transcription termination/antitermination protein NusG